MALDPLEQDPLAQDPFHVNVGDFVSIKLSGKTNYELWKRQMVLLLERYRMTHLIGYPLHTKKDRLHVRQNVKHVDHDRLVRGWILGSLTEDVMSHVLDHQTTIDLWQKLGKTYGVPPKAEINLDSNHNMKHLSQLYRYVLTGKWRETEDFFNKYPDTWNAKLRFDGLTPLHHAVATCGSISYCRSLLDFVRQKLEANYQDANDEDKECHDYAVSEANQAVADASTHTPTIVSAASAAHHAVSAANHFIKTIGEGHLHRNNIVATIESANKASLSATRLATLARNATTNPIIGRIAIEATTNAINAVYESLHVAKVIVNAVSYGERAPDSLVSDDAALEINEAVQKATDITSSTTEIANLTNAIAVSIAIADVHNDDERATIAAAVITATMDIVISRNENTGVTDRATAILTNLKDTRVGITEKVRVAIEALETLKSTFLDTANIVVSTANNETLDGVMYGLRDAPASAAKAAVRLTRTRTPTSVLHLISHAGSNLLHIAATVGNTEAAKKLVHVNSRLLFTLNDKGELPIHLAISAPHKKTFRFLLRKSTEFIWQVDNDRYYNPFEGVRGVVLLNDIIKVGYMKIALKLISKFPDIARGNYEGVATPMETIASSFDIYNRRFISDKLFDHVVAGEIEVQRTQPQYQHQEGEYNTFTQEDRTLAQDERAQQNLPESLNQDPSQDPTLSQNQDLPQDPPPLQNQAIFRVCGNTETCNFFTLAGYVLWSILKHTKRIVPYLTKLGGRVFGCFCSIQSLEDELADDKVKHNVPLKLLRSACKQVSSLDNVSSMSKHYKKAVLVAVTQDIPEALKEIAKHFPEALWRSQDYGLGLIQLAILHRCPKVYHYLVYEMDDAKFYLRKYPHEEGNNLLHLAAKLTPMEKLNMINGEALQMQHEVQWFKVKRKWRALCFQIKGRRETKKERHQ